MKGPVTTTLSLLVSPNSYVFSAQQIFPHTFISTCTWFKSYTILHFKNTIPNILNSNLSYSYNPNRNTFQIPTCALFWSMRLCSDLAATLEVLLNGVVVQDPPNPNWNVGLKDGYLGAHPQSRHTPGGKVLVFTHIMTADQATVSYSPRIVRTIGLFSDAIKWW